MTPTALPSPDELASGLAAALADMRERLAADPAGWPDAVVDCWQVCPGIESAAVWAVDDSPRRVAGSGDPSADAWRGRLVAQVASRGEIVLARAGQPSHADDAPPCLIAFLPVPSGTPGWLVELAFEARIGPTDDLTWTLRELETLLAGHVRRSPAPALTGNVLVRPAPVSSASPAELDGMLTRLSESLDSRRVATTLACEASRLTGADRVTVTLAHGPRQRLTAAAGVDRIDPRAEVAGPLARLAALVAAGGQPLVICPGATELAPELEVALDRYLELVPARELRLYPLRGSRPLPADGVEDREQRPSPVVGVLIVEQFAGPLAEAATPVLDALALRGGTQLALAVTHDRLFLMPLWKLLGQGVELFRGRYRRQATAITVGMLVAAVLLAVVPIDFDLPAGGTLEPVIRRNVFAEANGTVSQLAVETGAVVMAGQRLVTLEDPSLTLELERTAGELAATHERLRAVELALLKKRDISDEDRRELSGQRVTLTKQRDSLTTQHALQMQRASKLVIVSPLAGTVQTWEATSRLTGRPVQAGQLLLTVADGSGPWRLELWLEEHQAGHLIAAMEGSDGPPAVRFRPASQPSETLTGTVATVEPAAGLHPEAGNAVRVTVDLDPATRKFLGTPRAGQGVAARVHVGKAPAGYVWLHRTWEWTQTNLLF